MPIMTLDNSPEPVLGQIDFEWSYTEEPHATRRKEILAKYPKVCSGWFGSTVRFFDAQELSALHGHCQVATLFGVDPWLKYKVSTFVFIQLFLAFCVRDMNWPALLVLAYCCGGTFNHALTLGMHEISHNLAFKKIWQNKLFGIVSNMPLSVPSFMYVLAFVFVGFEALLTFRALHHSAPSSVTMSTTTSTRL